MKKSKLIFVFISLVMVCFTFDMYATSQNPYNVDLSEEPSDDIIENPLPDHRMPARKIMCEISRENGVVIYQSGIADDIVSYEVYDTTGACIAIFNDEQSFIDFIFSGISGEYLLRFRTQEHTYSGIISIK